MAKSRDSIEGKVSQELSSLPKPLVYARAGQFTGDILDMPNGKEVHDTLETACIAGNVEKIKEILEANNIGVNAKFKNDNTLLAIAVQHNQKRLARFLLNEPEIHVSLNKSYAQGSLLGIALRVGNSFKDANYEMARDLINAGALINNYEDMPILMWAWYFGNQEAANQLVRLGASIHQSEQFFNNVLNASHHALSRGERESIRQQIASSKNYLNLIISNAKDVGMGFEELCCSRQLGNTIGSNIASFVLGSNPLVRRVFNATRDRARQLLPEPAMPLDRQIPCTLLFMGNVENLPKPIQDEIVWQQWENEYNRQFPDREEQGYGPGATVVRP